MLLQTWADVLTQSFQNLWLGVISFVPNLVVALVIFVFGWIVGALLGRVVAQVVRSLKVDHALSSTGLDEALNQAGFKLDTGAFLGGLVKWFLVIVSLLAAVNILGLTQVSSFLRDVLLYIPNVVVAAMILLIAALVADTVEHVVRGSVQAAGFKGGTVGVVVRWAIWTFAVIAALLQLGIAADLIRILITGFVAALAVAFGLAFGLGGKEHAAAFIEDMKRDMGGRM